MCARLEEEAATGDWQSSIFASSDRATSFDDDIEDHDDDGSIRAFEP